MTGRPMPKTAHSTRYWKPDRWTIASKAIATMAAAVILVGCGVISEADREPDASIATSAVPIEQVPPRKTVGIPESDDESSDSAEVSPAINENQESPSLSDAEMDALEQLAGCGGEAEQRTREELIDRARTCLDFYKNGTIGVVDYTGGAIKDLDEVIEFLTEHLHYLTGGLMQLTFILMPASDAALAKFEERTPASCSRASDGDLEDSAAWIADMNMPNELAEVDKILALTSVPSCGGPVGLAFDFGAYRYSEVFDVVEESGFWRYYLDSTSLHEVLHLTGLGHSSGLVVEQGGFNQLDAYTQEDGVRIHLHDYLADTEFIIPGRWSGIGESAVMGFDANLYSDVLSAREMHRLQLPHRVLNERPESGPLIAIDDLNNVDSVKYKRADVGHKFAKFSVAVTIPTLEDEPQFMDLNSLDFTPGKDLYTGELALNIGLSIDSYETYATIGRILGEADFELFLDDGTIIHVLMDGETISIDVEQ